eukprot:scaffold3065_cov389-Prasinococcus_capsulatus_cf.AAC.22
MTESVRQDVLTDPEQQELSYGIADDATHLVALNDLLKGIELDMLESELLHLACFGASMADAHQQHQRKYG